MTASSGAAALSNARQVDTYPQGYCLKYVRAEAWRIGGLYGSAIDAWHGAIVRHPGDRNPPLGAPCFYEGGQYGHVVIWAEDPKEIRGTDMPSSGRVSEDALSWPEVHFGQKYLGWTEDLNAVDLPIAKDEDDMKDEDFQRIREIVRDEVAKNNPPASERLWNQTLTVTKPDGKQEDKSTRQILRETWQRVAKL